MIQSVSGHGCEKPRGRRRLLVFLMELAAGAMLDLFEVELQNGCLALSQGQTGL